MNRTLFTPFVALLLLAAALAACGEPAPARSPSDAKTGFPSESAHDR